MFCTKQQGRGLPRDFCDAPCTVRKTTNTRILCGSRSRLGKACKRLVNTTFKDKCSRKMHTCFWSSCVLRLQIFNTWRKSSILSTFTASLAQVQWCTERNRYSTFPLGLPNCTWLHIRCGRGTDIKTPRFVWKQYSFEWETFSMVRQGNPTLN